MAVPCVSKERLALWAEGLETRSNRGMSVLNWSLRAKVFGGMQCIPIPGVGQGHVP